MTNKKDNIDLPGYPMYPASEDVYSKDKEETDINPEDISQTKEPNEEEEPGDGTNKVFYDNVSGSDLDVPGNEADEKQENAGSEDEENNFYSLGGDDHNDLEEDNSANPTEI